MTNRTDKKYQIRNWKEYNRALVNRGSLTIWFDEKSVKNWISNQYKGRGRPKFYSDEAILCALVIKAVYRLPFRALRGFILSLVQLLGLFLPIPCYTRICRRAAELGQQIKNLGTKKPKDIVFDSSGLKVYGEGEWKIRQHGKSKRRTWRKIHIALCPNSHEIVLSHLSENSEADCEVIPKMRRHLPKSIKRSYGDGAYDKDPCYQEFHSAGIQPIIPPQRGAILHDLQKEPWMESRNNAIRAIKGLGDDDEARKVWKKLMGYHQRSLGETGFYRWKTILGGELKSRKIPNQRGEVFAKSIVLNRMANLGMPKGCWVMA
jgi:hypothetical protein